MAVSSLFFCLTDACTNWFSADKLTNDEPVGSDIQSGSAGTSLK